MSGERVPLLLYHSVADTVDCRFAEWAVMELFGGHMFKEKLGARPLEYRFRAPAAHARRRGGARTGQASMAVRGWLGRC